MDRHRHRFSVTPFLLAFFTALLSLQPTTVVKVNARGLGHEHEQRWRRTPLVAAPLFAARTIVASIRERLDRVCRHALFGPAVAVATLAIAFVFNATALMAAPVLFGVLTEGQHAGEFIMEERGGIGHPSRENITVLSGQNLKAGAVIGRVTVGVGRVSTPTVVGTGNGTASLVFAGPECEVGNYVLTCTSAVAHGGVFSLTTPGGKTLPSLTLTAGAGNTTAYTSRHINFSITDGSTDFIVGDAFTFVVSTTAPAVIGTGNGTISGLSLGPDAIPGNYRVENITAITNGGTFKVVGPDGDEVAVGSIVAGAGGTLVLAGQRQLNLTITDGSTDFAVGDAFNVAVFNQLAGGKVVAWDPTTFDGRHKAVGLLYDNVDASSGDLAGAIVTRHAAVIKSALQWGAAITSSQKESAYADLAARGVIAR